MRVEMILYHALDATGSIEISATSSSGPWTKLTLTSPKPVSEALAEWQGLANAAIPSVSWFCILTDGTRVSFETSDAAWVRLSPCLALLLGFSATVVDAFGAGAADQTPHSMADSDYDLTIAGPTGFAVGTTFPAEVDSADLTEYRGARAATHHYGRATEVVVDLFVSPELWALTEASPLWSGHCAFLVVVDNYTPYDEDNLDGALVVYPLEELARERESDEDTCWIQFRCTVGTPTVPATNTRWTQLAAALPYGYAMYYIARMHGIPELWLEVEADAIAPDDFGLDATLVIDRSSRLGGTVVNGDTKAMDHEMRLLDSDKVRTYFGTRPQRQTQLTAALTASATTMEVVTARPWEGLTEVYIGLDCIPFSGRTDESFTGLDRSTFQRPRSYPIGTPVTDGPNQFQGRQVDVHAADIDPCGFYVQTANVLDTACMIWSGRVADRPVREGPEWVINVSDQVRRLNDPLGAEASGKAVWTDDDDALLPVPVAMRFVFWAEAEPTTGTIISTQIQPFATYSTSAKLRASVMRQIVADALAAASSGSLSFSWVKHNDTDPSQSVWELMMYFVPDPTDLFYEVIDSICYDGDGIFLDRQQAGNSFLPSQAYWQVFLLQPVRMTSSALSVRVDDGDAADLPTVGMVVVESGGVVDYAAYESLEVDTNDGQLVHLTLAGSDRIFGVDLDAIMTSGSEMSVRFLWHDSGSLADIARRAIVSTGDAQHGTYDTLPKGQGLSLPMIDEDSFDRVFGSGLFTDLDFQIYEDAGATFATLFGGIFRLSRTAVVTRRRADGTGVDLAAVDIGSVDSGVPVTHVTEDILVTTEGRKPVRIKSVFEVPQAIQAKARTAPVNDVPAGEGTVPFRDPHLSDWTGLKWDLDIYGLDRETVRSVGRGWALGIFRAGETSQVVEVDVPLWFDGQAGDVIDVDLQDVTLWDYAIGVPGYVGLARVLGDPFTLASGVKVITIACDGIYAAAPMCPSLPIYAVNGTSTAPTSIDVEDVHYDLLVAAKDGQASWRVHCYQPGLDAPYQVTWTISDITLPGGGVCRLTVTAYPTPLTVALTTSYRLTWPHESACTANQVRYLHTDDDNQWSS